VRIRMRTLVAVAGIAAFATIAVGPAAFAAEGGESPGARTEATVEEEFADHTAEECFNLLREGKKVDDCQKAPSPLVPAIDEIIWGSLAFAVLVVFFFWKGVPAIKNMEKAREDRIRNDLESAERARTEAEAEKAQYEAQIADSRNEGGRIIEEARQSAEQVRRDLIARAEADAEEIRARARADIANQQAQAMSQLQGDVANLAIDLAGRVVERNLDDATNRQLVDSFIEQVGGSN